MALTVERAEKLASYLKADESRKALLELPVEEAAAKINADGNDFTVEELKEFGETLQQVAAQSENGELDAASLEGVSGGGIAAGAVAACCAVFAAGYKFGSDIAIRYGW